jgi:pimeloyl-ACP methyl ester carboxylesterase
MEKAKNNVGFITIMLVMSLLFACGWQGAFAVPQQSAGGYAAGSDAFAVDSLAASAYSDDSDIHDVEIIFCTNRVMLKDKAGNVLKDKRGFIRFGSEVSFDPPLWGVATFHKDKAFKDGRAVQRAFSVSNMLVSNARLHVPKKTGERFFATTDEVKQYLAQAVKDSGQPDVVAFFPGSDGDHRFYEDECAAFKFRPTRFDRHKRVYVVFDYAARGNRPGPRTYFHDRRIVGASEADAEGMVDLLVQVVGREHIVFKSHSMGCLLAVRVAKHFADLDAGMLKVDPSVHVAQFKSLGFIFADVDLLTYKKVFAPAMRQMFKYPPDIARSGVDKLLPLSHILNGKRRLGEHRGFDIDDIPGHTITDYTHADCPLWGHAPFFQMSEDTEEFGDPTPGWRKDLVRKKNDCEHYVLKRVRK